MEIDADDQRGEGSSLGDNFFIDLYARVLPALDDEETKARRGKEEQRTNMFVIYTLRTTKESFLGKRKIDHACDSLQNPSYRHDYASSSSLSSVESKSRRMVSDEPIRAEPIREVLPPVRKRNLPVRRKGPVKKEPVRTEPGVTPEWVVNLMREKNGVDAVRLIIEKEITASDLKRNEGRLLMPFNQMADMNFLNEAELDIMEKDGERSRKQGVDVILVDSDGTQWELNLKRWEMKSTSNYSLCGGWNKVVFHHEIKRRKLKEGQTIRLWSFHSQDGKLFFAFLRLPPAPAPGMAQPQAQDPAPGMAQPQAQDPDQAVAQPQVQDPALAVAQPQAHDPDQAVAQPQAHDPDQAMPLALAPSIVRASSSSSSMASDVTRDSDNPFICVETNRRLPCNFPRRRMIAQACFPAPAPTRDSGNLGQSI